MAKESGLGANFYLGSYDLSGDTNALGSINKSLSPLDFTGINVSANERKAGLLDGEISWTSFWNPTNAHLALRNHPRTDRITTYFHRQTIGTPTASLNGKQVNYDPSPAQDGTFTASVQVLADDSWLDWGLALTPSPRTDTTATSGDGVDFTAGNDFGMQAYLHVVAFTGTSATITIQESSDDGSGDAYTAVTGGAFSTVTGVTSERLETARDQTIERYLRVVTTGTFTNLVFVVAATINQTDMVKV
jgi:hypothetical protein